MRTVTLVLLTLSLSRIPVFAQETNEAPSEWKVRTEQLVLQYQTMSPEYIWQEYVASETTRSLAMSLHLYKEPYFSWGIEELLKRELHPQACGIVLSRKEYAGIKDAFFEKCIDRPYTFEELQSMIIFTSEEMPPKYLRSFIDKVLENWDLSTPQLTQLVLVSPLPEQRAQIVLRMNLSILDGGYACNINHVEIPGYSEFLNYLCDTKRNTDFFDAKKSALYEIMKKGN